MMGDEMAVRSGGMYGNPESSYTLATPSSMSSWRGYAGTATSFVKAGLNLYANRQAYKAQQKQLAMDYAAIQEEKTYNLRNYSQYIADTLANNKMSFYASGLDINSGTPANVLESNRVAMTEDWQMMKSNYNRQLAGIERQQKANRRNFIASNASAILSVF